MKDLKGKKFGKLTVIDISNKTKDKRKVWICKCECGKLTEVTTNNLTTGNVKSCGCLRNKLFEKTHGKTNTRIYRIWSNMKSRCQNKNATYYSYYGGKGIKICKEWIDNFEEFYKWSIKNGYKNSMTLDRINGEDDYKPSNCRWVTMKTQNLNRKSNIHILFNDKEYTMEELAKELNVTIDSLYKRRRSKSKWYVENCKEIKK